MLGEVGDLAQSMGDRDGEIGEDVEKVELRWVAFLGSMEGVVLGASSISPILFAMDPRPKKGSDMRVEWG